MYNKDMLSPKKQHTRYMRAHLKRQRLLAKKHRKYMRLRAMRESRAFVENSLSVKKTLTSVLGNIWFGIKEFAFVVKTVIELAFINLRYRIQKLWYRSLDFFIERNQEKTSSFEQIEIMNYNESSSSPLRERRTTKKRKKRKGVLFKKIVFTFGIGALILFGLFFVWVASLEIPSIQNFENRKISNSTKIYDRTGEVLLYDIHENIRRTVVDFNGINQNAKDAIVAIEDHTFYEHGGVVWKSTIRAIVQTTMSKLGLSSAGTAGGSTITQQVVKNTLLNRDQIISRKVKEWVLAYKIEGRLLKDEILEIYLNEAPYGGTIYGIEEASKRFFGVPASEVTVGQAAYLAAIPNLPTYYSPYGPNKSELDLRQQTVLREMKRYGFISDTQYRSALEEDVEFQPEEDSYAKSLHFVQYVRAQLEETYGTDMVENGGLQVITTLDYELQQQAEEIIGRHIEEVEEDFDASNAALVAVESSTGHILTMVGSRDYFDTDEFDGNFNVALSPRQPGSAFKPLAYAAAFEQGYLPESTIFDTETQFNSRCEKDDTTSEEGCYSPNNYDFDFKGPMSFRSALAQSRNIPAIKVTHLAGLNRVIEKSRDMGISSLRERADFYGLGLVLGGGEVSLLEMTSAYTVLANEGIYNKPTGILEITDLNGNTLEKYLSNEERVLKENAARMVNSILSDNVARTPLFGSQSFLYFGERDVAGKTGTTNDNRDAWLIGYIPQVAVGVWTGNNDNSPMKKGSSISGKPWREFMSEIIKNYDNESFTGYDIPDDFNSYPNMIKGDWYGGTTTYIDSVSGKLATEFTPEETKIAVPQPDPHTILHWINKNNPRVVDTSRDDAQYESWEYGVQGYVQEHLQSILNIEIDLPTDFDDVHTSENSESFRFIIEGIDESNRYALDEEIEVDIESQDRPDREIDTVQFFINNAFVDDDTLAPFTFKFVPSELQYFEEYNLIRVIVTDEDGIKATQEISFTIEL
ncbi:MAG: membrane peptidoglycan carboxypeptidase [Candidatus Paceibacteria bacterium]|jgi:membrane peptidoglycan carboxypeptidase